MVLTYKIRSWDVQGTNNAIALFGGVFIVHSRLFLVPSFQYIYRECTYFH